MKQRIGQKHLKIPIREEHHVELTQGPRSHYSRQKSIFNKTFRSGRSLSRHGDSTSKSRHSRNSKSLWHPSTLKKSKIKRKPEDYRFFIDKQNRQLQNLYLTLTGEKDAANLKKTKLTKGKLKAYLVNKYDGVFADKILRVIGEPFRQNKEGTLNYDEYCNFVTELVNFQTDLLFQMAFNIYDYNGNE